MLNYLEKFNSLSSAIKQQVSTPAVLASISEIGKRYQIDLANIVMRIMIKEIDVRYLANYFMEQHGFDQARAQHLENELKEKVLADVMNYLYRKPIIPPATDDQGVPLTDNEDDYWQNRIDKIITDANLSLGSSDLDRRLHNILLTYLKHVRDRLATIDALTKAFDSGGIGLDKQSAINLLTAVDGQQPNQDLEVRRPSRIPVPEDRAMHSRDADYDLVRELAKKQAAVATTPVLAPLTPAVQPEPAPVAKPQPKPEIPQTPVPKPQPPVPKPQPIAKPIEKMRKTESGKIKMDDIQGPPKVFTPVDELRYLTLKNMRNLDKDPWQAIEKIKAKLEALKKEDYGNLVAGIKAWKQSPLHKLYVDIYQVGLNSGQPAQAVLQAKLQQDPNSLTEQEFEAIIKLNQDLKF